MRVHPAFFEPSTPSELVLVGGDDPEGVAASARRLLSFASAAPSATLADISLTAGVEARNARLAAAIVAESADDLAAKLKALLSRLECPDRPAVARRGVHLPAAAAGEGGRLAFVFPGEGSQYPHMLRNICMSVPECLSAFDEADAACISAGGAAPSRWIFPPGMVDEDARYSRIDMADGAMAVIAADVAYMRLLSGIDLRADGTVGVGVGEIAALEYAGVSHFPDKRSRIAALSEGYVAMHVTSDAFESSATQQFSVSGIPAGSFREALARYADSVRVSRILADDKFGVCVRAEAAPAFSRALSAAGAVVRQLPFNRPFHTEWFGKAVPDLARHFKVWFSRSPRLPVYSCVDGAPLPSDIDSVRAASLAQWTRPVDFASAVRRMASDGFRLFLEVGARGSLSVCVDAILGDAPHLAVPMNRVHRGGIQQVHNALAALAAYGVRFDAAALHLHDGARMLDFSKPSRWKRARQPRLAKIETALPVMRLEAPPQGLLPPAPASRPPAKDAPSVAAAGAPGALPASSAPSGGTRFPLLIASRIVSEDPGKSITLRQALSFADLPVLADCALCAPGISVADPMRHGLPVVTLAYCAELLAEAACHLAPDNLVTRVENLHILRWITLDTARRVVRLRATARPPDEKNGAPLVDAEILDGSGEDGSDDSPLARATFRLSPAPVQPQPLPAVPLSNPRKTSLEGDELYEGRLFAGSSNRSLRAVTSVASNGLEGVIRPVPAECIVHGAPSPVFDLDPRILSSIGNAIMAFTALDEGAPTPLFQAVRRMEFSGVPVDSLGDLSLRLALSGPEAQGVGVFQATVSDTAGNIVATVHGGAARLFPLPPRFRRALCSPVECFLSHPLPGDVLPALPQDVFCRVSDGLPADLLADPQELWLKAAAAMSLSSNELPRWRYMGGTTFRRHEWLMGRVAAKDAVRSCLRERYDRKWAAADVAIETDDAGKPVPQGPWRRHCGAMMDVSITHNPELVVAAAAPNARVGIDIERCDRRLSDTFIDGAFSQEEQEVAAESGEGAVAMIRFWSAKEALSKALGTGLRYGSSDLVVRSYDPASGRIELVMTRLWTEVFPEMRDVPVTVHSGLLGDCILSLCVLQQ